MNKDTVNFSLDWGDSPSHINESEPTISELRIAMENLRSILELHNYPIPYAYTLCRKEVAYELDIILSKNDSELIIEVMDLKESLRFDPHNNCYLKYLVVARHPKALEKALEEIAANLQVD